MMKRVFSFILLIFMLSALSVCSFGAEHCRCGRVLTKTGVCSGCNKLPNECICHCWCGSEAVLTETDDEGYLLVCKKCGSVCSRCTCKDIESYYRLSELDADGKIMMKTLPKTDWQSELILFLMLALVAFIITSIFVSKKTEQTIEREKAERQTRKNHAKIMDKIQSQAGGVINPSKKSGARVSAEKKIGWPIESCGGGICAYELTNAVRFHGFSDGTVTDFTMFSLAYQLDAEGTIESAFKGSYGKTAENLTAAFMAARSTEHSQIKAARPYFETEFFEKNEENISNILLDTSVDETSVHQLLKLPFNMTSAVGSSVPQVTRFAKEKCNEYSSSDSSDTSYLKENRFSCVDKWGGIGK